MFVCVYTVYICVCFMLLLIANGFVLLYGIIMALKFTCK